VSELQSYLLSKAVGWGSERALPRWTLKKDLGGVRPQDAKAILAQDAKELQEEFLDRATESILRPNTTKRQGVSLN
jgi:hypothetical protein